MATSDQVVEFDGFTLDMQHRLLLWKTEQVSLSPKQFDLLCFFTQNPGRTLTKEEILQAVWPDQFVEEGSLTQTVFWVRKALAHGSPDTDDARRHIVTIPGKGYQFNFLEAPPGMAPWAQKHSDASGLEDSPQASASPRRPRVWVYLAVAGPALITGISMVAYYAMHRSSAEASSAPLEVILGDFSDATPDASLQTALGTALRIGLEQYPPRCHRAAERA